MNLRSSRIEPIRFLSVTLSILFTTTMLPVMPSAVAQGTGYWHTSGSQILDSQNKRVRIAGLNWYGFETTDAVVHGLTSQDYQSILNTIAVRGYNTIRLPFSDQMVASPTVPSAINFTNGSGPINSDLKGLNSLQIMDKVIQSAGKLGLKVILDNHRSEAGNSNESSGLWYTTTYPETRWIADWKLLAGRYKSYTDSSGNPTVIGVDLRNEPHLIASEAMTGSCWTGDTASHGCPVTNTAQNWPAAASRAANSILGVNASLLIFVEGTDCYSGDCGWQGGNLEGARKYPVQIAVANRLVYSPHDYGPDLYLQPWFTAQTSAASLASVWTRFWGYLSVDGTAPIWVGEFGTTNNSSDVESNTAGSQGQWFQTLISFLSNHPSLQWAYWALNGEDSFGLLDSNYDAVPTNSIKEQLLESIQFPLNGGARVCKAVPGAPTGLTAVTSSSSEIGLTWKGGTSSANCSVNYSVFRSTTSGFTASASNQVVSGINVASFSDTGLIQSTRYYYVVEATNGYGSSNASGAANATTKSAGGIHGAACHVAYSITSQWNNGFQAAITISNTGSTTLSNWTLQWTFPQDQQILTVWNVTESQTGKSVTLTNLSYNGSIAPGGNVSGIGFTANVGGTNTAPMAFILNGIACK